MKKILSLLVILSLLSTLSACQSIVRTAKKAVTAEPSDMETTAAPDTTADEETTSPPHTTEAETSEAEETTEADTTETFPEEGPSYPSVLMYHCVHDEPYTENTALFVRPSELESHLQALNENGIKTLFADEFGPAKEKSVILTFDDGYEDNYTYMFPLIKEYNIKVTVFMIGYKIDKPGYLSSAQIKEMSDSGLVQFGCHTLDHPMLTTLSDESIKEQFAGTNWLISEITGKDVTTVAYPAGNYNSRVTAIAREYFKFAYTTDANYYWGQDDMMLPRYAILRGVSAAGFMTYVE